MRLLSFREKTAGARITYLHNKTAHPNVIVNALDTPEICAATLARAFMATSRSIRSHQEPLARRHRRHRAHQQ
jgi:hypothetical protein